ncbi:hypothetical protein M2140_000783, partial [Clostridiales Family XIII bacterium PM5-7]
PVSFSGKLIIPESRVSGSFIFLNLHHYMGTTIYLMDDVNGPYYVN